MKQHLTFLAIALAICFSSCDKDATRSNSDVVQSPSFNYEGIKLTKSQEDLTSGINEFGFGLYKELAGNGNMLISPFSISTTLSIIASGADSETENEIASRLGFEGKSISEINEYHGYLSNCLKNADTNTFMGIANAIVANTDENVILNKSFIEQCKKYYSASVIEGSFQDQSTSQALNEWAKSSTNGLLPQMANCLIPDEVVKIINIVAFESKWPFEFKRSVDGFMRTKLFTYVMNSADCSVLALPYGNGAYEIDVILPAEGASLETVMKGMTSQKWNELNRSSQKCLANVSMPCFWFEYGISLNEALGINATTYTAAFDKMVDSSDHGVAFFDLSHRSFISVDEKGTTAVAGTNTAGFSSPSAPEKYVDVDFKVDKPFLFVIRERSAGAIIFIGQYTDL